MSSVRGSRWAVFISGRGSNMQALLDLCEEVHFALVVSSSANAPGLIRAKRQGIPTLILEKKINWQQLSDELIKRGINKIFLAGFMKLIPESFVNQWTNKILNVHPSLLPLYPGLRAIENSYMDGAAMGASVHIVVPEMDAGKLLFQQKALAEDCSGRHQLSLAQVQLLISRAEQRLVREAALRWN